MISQSMANYLYSLNQRRTLYISKNNAFVSNLYDEANKELDLYKSTSFYLKIKELYNSNQHSVVYFKRKSDFINKLYKFSQLLDEEIKNLTEKNKKRAALLVGINYVGTKSELRGCENDVYNTKQILIHHYGFKEDEIIILTESEEDSSKQPTVQNIANGLNWLVNKGNNGYNSLWFQYSGHGYYFTDQNGDEKDGLDECIVTSDNVAITDDQFRSYLVKRLPKECDLFCLMDCCHSGTMLDLKYKYKVDADAVVLENNVIPQCNVISISGCRDNQTSADAWLDGNFVGALTKTFLDVIKENEYKNNEISLFEMVKEVRNKLQEKRFEQVPQLTSSHVLDNSSTFSI